MGELRVGEFLTALLPRLRSSKRREIPRWPPDVFGLMAALVQRAGLYGAVLTSWPPKPDYAEQCRALSCEWREAIETDRLPPAVIRDLWGRVIARWECGFSAISGDKRLREAILRLMAIADECGAGLGGMFDEAGFDGYENAAAKLLGATGGGSTLCEEVHPSRLRVLPKRRTPPTGLNARSLSLYLSCSFGCEVTPQWALLQSFDPASETVNVLVIPYPFAVNPLEFAAVRPERHEMANMDGGRFAFFTVERDGDAYRAGEIVRTALEKAERSVGRVHLVVLPEAALTPEEYDRVRTITESHGVVLMAGVGIAARDGDGPGRNAVHIADPFYAEFVQEKHHRWRLNASQIFQYELGATLNPARDWWEYIAVHDRRQHFLQVAEWLLTAPLICEDLARPDPVGDLVRAVGPDLVVAFLMDGPQLPARWPARYATVLADDPGCSVLTVTSLGMALRSQPPEGMKPSRQIASWKDPVNGLRGLCLPEEMEGAGAVVLTLNRDTRRDAGRRQVSADGRVNRLTEGFPILSRVQWIDLGETVGVVGAKEGAGEGDKIDMLRMGERR